MSVPTKLQTKWATKELLVFLMSLTNATTAQLSIISAGSLVKNGLLVRPNKELPCVLASRDFLLDTRQALKDGELVIKETKYLFHTQSIYLTKALEYTLDMAIFLQENRPKNSYRAMLPYLEQAQKRVEQYNGVEKPQIPRPAPCPSTNQYANNMHQRNYSNAETDQNRP